MKKETVERLLQAADKEVQRHGFNDWHAAMEFASDALRKFADLIPDGPRLEKVLSDAPEPPPDELEQILQMIEKVRESLVTANAEAVPKQNMFATIRE